MAENKFSSKKFTASRSGVSEDYPDKEEKPFVRDDSDNKLFPQLQIKDLSEVTDSNTRWKLDADGIVYKAASIMENLYIVVKNKDTGEEVELEGLEVFKGKGKSISENSWLGVENIKREAKNLTPYSVEDFDVEQKQRLKMEKDKALEQAKIMINMKLKGLRNQFGIKNIDICIGGGSCFREDLPTVELYKGNRKDSLRPLLLKELRDWVMKEKNGEYAPEGYENDDYVEWWGYKGWLDYKKTKVFSYGVIAEDKDSFSNPKLLINFGQHTGEDNPFKGDYKFPQAWIIPDSTISSGETDLVVKSKKEFKASGLKWLLSQAFLIGDTADHYNALKHLKNYKTNFGDVGAYELLSGVDSPKDCVQAVVDLYAKFFPYGVEYVDHRGDEQDVDTITYMNTYYLVAYMTRSSNDKMDFFKLCKAFKVDTSAIENNNLWTAPYEVVDVDKLLDIVQTYDSVTDDLNSKEFKSYKSDKKDGLVNRLDIASESLSEVREYSRNNVYKLVQRNKQTGEIRDFKEK